MAQHIAATIILVGAQDVAVNAHGTGRGGHVSLTTPDTMITLHNLRAVRRYAEAWTDAVGSALYLPATRPVTVERLSLSQPGVVVVAGEGDDIRSTYEPQRRELRIRIGCLTWIVVDRLAYDHMVGGWRQVQSLAEVVLPPR